MTSSTASWISDRLSSSLAVRGLFELRHGRQLSRVHSLLARKLDSEGALLSVCALPLASMELLLRAGLSASTLPECVEVMTRCLHATQLRDANSFGVAFGLAPQADGDELALLSLYTALAWLFGRRLPVRRVELPGAPPRQLRDVENVYAGTLHFRQPRTALWFGPECASLPVVRTPAQLDCTPASLIEALRSLGELDLQVREALQRGLPRLLSLAEVAEELAMSPRSLHRKLEQKASSFQSIKDDLRRELAMQALSRTSAPLKQIASEVGFADQASFQRAFTQWTGSSPGAWRRRAR